jgi:hypothetical protein
VACSIPAGFFRASWRVKRSLAVFVSQQYNEHDVSNQLKACGQAPVHYTVVVRQAAQEAAPPPPALITRRSRRVDGCHAPTTGCCMYPKRPPVQTNMMFTMEERRRKDHASGSLSPSCMRGRRFPEGVRLARALAIQSFRATKGYYHWSVLSAGKEYVYESTVGLYYSATPG